MTWIHGADFVHFARAGYLIACGHGKENLIGRNASSPSETLGLSSNIYQMTLRIPVAVGVDVGGRRKGFHAIALRGRRFLGKFESPDPHAVVNWIRSMDARAVGVDAPCRWSTTGRARQAERELMRSGIGCFSSPTLAKAQSHPSDYYGWMLNGAALFALLEQNEYHLFVGTTMPLTQRFCFETFPQAVACALAGEIVSAKRKATVRRNILRAAGIELAPFVNIDLVDAALCAVTANAVLKGRFDSYGDKTEGHILVPA